MADNLVVSHSLFKEETHEGNEFDNDYSVFYFFSPTSLQ